MAKCPVCGTVGAETGVLCPNECAYLVRESALEVNAKGLERYLGKLIGGRYAVVGYLGRGGMGVVYRARDIKGSGEVAVKVLLAHKPGKRAIRRFLREAKVAVRLRHPNIVATYGFGRVDDGFFLAMELVEGQPLSRYFRRGIPFDALVAIGMQTLSALTAAHDAGVIHRDLKPGNILVGRNERGGLMVKVVDFGLARFLQPERDTLTRTGELVGTPRYMSPEQARGSRDIDITTDLYALGVILYEFMAGKVLFDAEVATAVAVMHITEEVPPISPREGMVMPTGFEAVVRALLAKDQRSRPQSAQEVRSTLAPFLNQKRAASAPTPEIPLDPKQFQNPIEVPLELIAEVPSAQADGQIHFDPPLVGRRAPLQTLWDLHRRAIDAGEGAAVFVLGETGVGKSRLLEAFRDGILDSAEMDWFQGVTDQDGGHGLAAVRQAMAALFGLRHENRVDTQELIHATMERWGNADLGDVLRLTDFFRPEERDRPLVQGHFGDDLDDPERAERELLFSTLERCMRRAAAERPFILSLEDLHWCGAPTRELLDYMLPRLSKTPAPIVVLATFRSDSMSAQDWGGLRERAAKIKGGYYREEVLSPLDVAASKELLKAMFKAAPRLVEQIIGLTEGNPLHIISVLRFVQDKGLITEKAGRWDLGPDVRLREVLPPQTTDLMMARLEVLTQRHPLRDVLARVLERSALVGRRVPFRLLRSLLTYESTIQPPAQPLLPHLDEALDFFQAEGVLQEDVDDPEDVLVFSHGLLREVLVQRLRGRHSTRSMHLAAAKAKELYFFQSLDAHAEDIGNHFNEARQWDRAMHWYLRAGEVARRSWDMQACEGMFRRAQGLMNKLTRPSLSLRRRISEALGELCLTEGRLSEAQSFFEDAFDAAENGGEGKAMAHLLFLRGNVAREQSDFRRSDAYYRECLAVSRALGDRAGIGRALLGLSKLARHRSYLGDAHKFLTAAEEQFELLKDARALADCNRQRAFIYMRDGEWDAARRHLKKGLELNRRAEDKRGLAHVHRDMAQLDVLQGRYDHGQIHARKALNLFEAIGTQFGFAQTLSTMGSIHRGQGHNQAAGNMFQRALQVYEALDSGKEVARTLFQLGAVALKLGRPREARGHFTAAHERASLAEHAFLEGMGLAGLAWTAATADDVRSARTYLQHAHRRLPKQTLFVTDLVEIYRACAECFERHGESALALACQRKADVLSQALGRQ